MFIPDGMTYDEVFNSIKNAIRKITPSFTFGSYTIEDIEQEGWVIALQVLNKYNKSKNVPLDKFLCIHLRNRFLNLQRDHTGKRKPPCYMCPFFNKPDCKLFNIMEDCSKFANWKLRIESKKCLANVYDDKGSEREYDIENILNNREFKEYIDADMPANLMSDYHRLMAGDKISKTRKIKILEIATEALKRFGYIEDESCE